MKTIVPVLKKSLYSLLCFSPVCLQAQDSLKKNIALLEGVEIIHTIPTQAEKLVAVTRFPLSSQQQPQNIAIITEDIIQKQGMLSLEDAGRNVAGASLFSTFGGVSESISYRGFSAIPILKNGVPMNIDGVNPPLDMQGVDNIQFLKGAVALTQGFGSARSGTTSAVGGIINIVTKTPKFQSFCGSVGLRSGFWLPKQTGGNSIHLLRPTFDIQGSFNPEKTVAYRINGAFEYNNNIYKNLSGNTRYYVNPSFGWKITPQTDLYLEMDYLYDNRAYDPGTIARDVRKGDIYELPYNKTLGFNNVRTTQQNYNYALRLNHHFSRQLYLRFAYMYSGIREDGHDIGIFTGLSTHIAESATTIIRQYNPSYTPAGGPPTLPSTDDLYRSVNKRFKKDVNHVLQLDLMGTAIKTGAFTHTFQVGADYRFTRSETPVFSGGRSGVRLDIIDITAFNPERLLEKSYLNTGNFKVLSSTKTTQHNTGGLGQYFLQYKNLFSLMAGLRYSIHISAAEVFTAASASAEKITPITSKGFNPMLGLSIYPLPNIQLYGTYAYTRAPRSATQIDKEGNILSGEKYRQWETGIKSEWWGQKFKANITYYHILSQDINVQDISFINGSFQQNNFYIKGGSELSQGIEIELIGTPFKQLQLIFGYAYTDARFLEHTRYAKNSPDLSSIPHMVNVWAYYTLIDKAHTGTLSLGAGAYYVGARPYNVKTHPWINFFGILPGADPFKLPSYTLFNLQIAYQYKNYALRIYGNNLSDALAYSAYRNFFINRIHPRSLHIQFNYSF